MAKKTVSRVYLRVNLPRTKRDKKLINYIFKILFKYNSIHGRKYTWVSQNPRIPDTCLTNTRTSMSHV